MRTCDVLAFLAGNYFFANFDFIRDPIDAFLARVLLLGEGLLEDSVGATVWYRLSSDYGMDTFAYFMIKGFVTGVVYIFSMLARTDEIRLTGCEL